MITPSKKLGGRKKKLGLLRKIPCFRRDCVSSSDMSSRKQRAISFALHFPLSESSLIFSGWSRTKALRSMSNFVLTIWNRVFHSWQMRITSRSHSKQQRLFITTITMLYLTTRDFPKEVRRRKLTTRCDTFEYLKCLEELDWTMYEFVTGFAVYATFSAFGSQPW